MRKERALLAAVIMVLALVCPGWAEQRTATFSWHTPDDWLNVYSGWATPSYFYRGITYDTTTQYLYLMSYYQDGVSNIIVYRVNDSPGKRYRYLSVSGD